MLRITTLRGERGATLRLEGKLAQEWVREAEKEWEALAAAPQCDRIVIDLCGVSFVDDPGRELLKRMHSAGAKLIGTGLVTSALIEEICGQEGTSKKWIRNLPSLIFGTTFCLLAAFGGNLNAQEVTSVPPMLTLSEAIQTAQLNNRLIKNAVLTTANDEDGIAEARTYRFPSVSIYGLGSQLLTPFDFTFDQGVFGTYPGIGPVPATETKIHTPLRPTFYGVAQLSQPLSQQYKIGLNIQQARLTKLVDDQKLREQKQSIANQVKKAYYAILQTQSSLAASEENLKFDRELDRTTDQLVAEKAALKADSMNVKARIAQEEYKGISLHDTVASQKEQLNSLLGRDVRTDFTVVEVPEAVDVEGNLEDAQAKAIAKRPELQEAKLRVEQATVNRRTTKAGYIPDVSLAFSNLSFVNVNTMLPSNVASVGALITWDPIDWGRRKHELASATRTIEQSKNSANETESQILVEVAAKFRKLNESTALLKVTALQLHAQQEQLRVTMNQYQQKAALLKDVLQERALLEAATNQNNQALLAFWAARADFEKAVGEE